MRLLSLVAAVALLLATAGCGADDEPVARPELSPSPSSSTVSQAPSAAPERLFGDGIDLSDRVLVFGTPYDEAAPLLTAAFGEPSKDTGPIEPFSDYGSCPGTTLQVLEYGDGALQVLFGDVGASEPVLYQWALTGVGDPGAVPPASALVGDEATFAFGPGTSVGALREQVAEAFEIAEDELSLDPAFTVTDQSSGFSGYLTGTTSADAVTFVSAGTPCAG